MAASAIITVLVMFRAAAWSIDDAGMLLFLGWTILPYVVFLAVSILLEKFTSIPHKSLILCVVSLLMLGFTLFAYVGTLDDKSSTYGLIFLFVPIWLYIGSFILLIIGLIIAWLSKQPASGNV